MAIDQINSSEVLVNEDGTVNHDFYRRLVEIITIANQNLITGTGNPNGVTSGTLNQTYLDTAAAAGANFYVNTDGGTTWQLV